MYKKILALMIGGCICISTLMSASAATLSSCDLLEENMANQIEIALNSVEKTKSVYGLDDVDFNNLELGASITTYEYIDGDFEPLGAMIPVIFDNKIVASVFDVGNSNYSVETLLASKIEETGFDNLAVVYDRDEVYLFNGSAFVLLMKSGVCITERDDLDPDVLNGEEHNIVTTNLNEGHRVKLDLNSKQLRGILPFVKCDVKYVTQNPYDNLCWAASIAMVKNYKSGSSLTAPDVSKTYFGILKDEGLSLLKMQNCMRNIYGLNYTCGGYNPSESVIANNLANNYPVIGQFTWSSGTSSIFHVGVIYLDDPFSYYISLMDPLCGAVAAHGYNGTFWYYCTPAGVNLTLNGGLCYTWSSE